jgi:hypothetical protein
MYVFGRFSSGVVDLYNTFTYISKFDSMKNVKLVLIKVVSVAGWVIALIQALIEHLPI